MFQISRLMTPYSTSRVFERFIIHIMTFSGQSRAILSSWSKNVREQGRETGLGFYVVKGWYWREGSWEFPAGTKGSRTGPLSICKMWNRKAEGLSET